jgi:hypothetical protein
LQDFKNRQDLVLNKIINHNVVGKKFIIYFFSAHAFKKWMKELDLFLHWDVDASDIEAKFM